MIGTMQTLVAERVNMNSLEFQVREIHYPPRPEQAKT